MSLHIVRASLYESALAGFSSPLATGAIPLYDRDRKRARVEQCKDSQVGIDPLSCSIGLNIIAREAGGRKRRLRGRTIESRCTTTSSVASHGDGRTMKINVPC